jgi:hypothetical protein
MEILLTLGDVNAMLGRLEDKYGFSTDQFLRSPTCQLQVSPDEVFDWRALIDHRQGLLEEDADRNYLDRISGGASCLEKTGAEQVELAA